MLLSAEVKVYNFLADDYDDDANTWSNTVLHCAFIQTLKLTLLLPYIYNNKTIQRIMASRGYNSRFGNLPLDDFAHNARLLLLFRLTADVLEHVVHFLESLSRRLWNNEECKDKGEKAEDGKEGIRAVASVLN